MCEHVSTLSLGSVFVLGYALFLPGLWVLSIGSTAPKELLVAQGFFWSIYCVKPASLESSGMKFKEESARNRESKCSSLTFVAMEKAASGQKEVFSDLKTPNTCKHTHKYTSSSSLENPEVPHELHYKRQLYLLG